MLPERYVQCIDAPRNLKEQWQTLYSQMKEMNVKVEKPIATSEGDTYKEGPPVPEEEHPEEPEFIQMSDDMDMDIQKAIAGYEHTKYRTSPSPGKVKTHMPPEFANLVAKGEEFDHDIDSLALMPLLRQHQEVPSMVNEVGLDVKRTPLTDIRWAARENEHNLQKWLKQIQMARKRFHEKRK